MGKMRRKGLDLARNRKYRAKWARVRYQTDPIYRAKVLEQQARWRASPKGAAHIRQRNLDNYWRDPVARRAAVKRYYHENAEVRREYSRQYRKKHRAACRRRAREYAKKNRAQLARYMKRYSPFWYEELLQDPKRYALHLKRARITYYKKRLNKNPVRSGERIAALRLAQFSALLNQLASQL